MRYEIGTQPIPGYRIVEFLGEGSYGAVYKARGPGGVENALKFIRLDNKQGLKEFKSVSLVKKLRHANLVPIHAIWLRDSGGNVMSENTEGDSVSINLMGDKELVIAMGLGDQSLAQRLEEMNGRGVPLDKLIRYMEDSAKGIDYLNEPTHEPNNSSIIHCDIKPGNLLIVGGSVQVCDYGVAKALSKGGDFKKTMGAGTPAYAAPELINNDPCTQTDQYSLAITYYELRTGHLPFDETKALVSHLTGRLDFSRLDPAEQEVIRRATHMQPTKRYPTCLDMVEDLKVATGITLSRTGAIPMQATRRPVVSTVDFAPGPARSINDMLQKGAELVPDHRLVRLLGHGGYGQVWEATGPGDVPCALKIVRDQEAKGKQEFDILNKIRKLKHPNLLQLRGYWLLAQDGSRVSPENVGQPGTPPAAAVIISTDLAEKNLLQRMRECQEQGMAGLAPAELVDYVRQAAAAIDYLNANHIQHRDIKPENILLAGHTAYVSDFGLAKLVEGDGTAVHSSSSGMTLDYAAPELLQKRVTLWTDQYSLALTYVTLRTGRPPFPPHASVHEKIQARINGQLDLSAVSPQEREVLEVALNREPDRRFDNCMTMANRLASALGLDLPPLPMGSGPLGSGQYPPLPGRDSNLGRQSGTLSHAAAVRATPIPQAVPVMMESRLEQQRQPSEYKGTVLFADTAPMPSVPPPPANPWKTEPAATEKSTTAWQEPPPQKKGGVPALAWIAAAVVLAAGAGGYFAFFNNNKQQYSSNGSGSAKTDDKKTDETKGSGDATKTDDTKGKDDVKGSGKGTDVTKHAGTGDEEMRKTLENDLNGIDGMFAQGNVKDGLAAIVAFEAKNPPADLRSRSDALKTAWALLERKPATDDDVSSLMQDYRTASAKLSSEVLARFKADFGTHLAASLKELTPTLDADVNWPALAEACTEAEPGPAIAALLAECWREIKSAGQEPKFPKPDLSDNAEPLALFVRTLDVSQERKLPEAVKLLEQLAPAGEAAAVVEKSPRRAKALGESAASAIRALRRGGRQQLNEPFAKDDATAVQALSQAVLASAAIREALPAAKLNELKIDGALAGWMTDNATPAQAKLVDELREALQKQMIALDGPTAVQLQAMVAASRPDTPEGRRQRIEAYRELLVRAGEGNAVPRSFVFEQVLKPLSSDQFADSLIKADAATKDEAARLLAKAAHDLRAGAEEWKTVESLRGKPLAEAIGLLDRAVEISRKPEFAAWRGIFRSEMPDAKFADLQTDLAAAQAADPADPLTKTLAGIAANAKAREEPDHGRRLADYRTADINYREAIAACERERQGDDTARRRELALLYKHAADNLILLANGDQSNLKAMGDQLAQSIDWADRLITLEPQRWDGFDTRGCALEDQAWLLRARDRFDAEGPYARAVNDFQQAIGGNEMIGEGQRSVARMHLGRCLYKWAEDKVRMKLGLDDAMLRRAETDLETAFKESDEDAFGIRAECMYWLGCCRMLRHELAAPAEARTLYEAAVKDYTRSLEYTARGSGSEWFDLAATGLGFAHIREAARLMASRDRTGAEAVLDRLNETINAKQPRALAPIWKIRLDLYRLDMLAQLATEPDRFPEIVSLVDEAKALNCESQHRYLQVQSLLFRSDAYSTMPHFKKHHDDAKALRDAGDALAIARDEPAMLPSTRAEAYAKQPTLKYAAAIRERTPLEKLSDSRRDFETACALAPDHVNAANWRFQAGAIAFREEFIAEEAKQSEAAIARLIAASVNHFGEVGRLAPAEGTIAKFARKQLEGQQENFRRRLREAGESSDAAPNDRRIWKLADFELESLTATPDADRRKEIQTLVNETRQALTDVDDAVMRREMELQIARVEKLLGS